MRASNLPILLVLAGGCLLLFFGAKADDLPLPTPEPTPDVPQKWQVALFHETASDTSLPMEQRAIVTGLVFRQGLESRGHRFLGSFDVSSFSASRCVNGVCQTIDATPEEVRPFWDAAKTFALPSVALSPLAGGSVQVYSLPTDPESFYGFLEGLR